MNRAPFAGHSGRGNDPVRSLETARGVRGLPPLFAVTASRFDRTWNSRIRADSSPASLPPLFSLSNPHLIRDLLATLRLNATLAKQAT